MLFYVSRCIVLTEPNKLDSKSSESWSLFFQRLRTLLLEAFNRHLNKYEEGMRSRREKRNEPGWNYFSYFIVQVISSFKMFTSAFCCALHILKVVPSGLYFRNCTLLQNIIRFMP